MPSIRSEPQAGPRAAPPRRDLVFVSAGLELDGGGRALAGRLLAAGSAAYARERGIGWSLLSLGGLDGFAPGGGARAFGGRQGALALAIWRRQVASGRRFAFIYDLLGPARAQAWLPPPLRAPYLVATYGIEVWRSLSGTRSRALRHATVRLATSSHTLARARAANGDFGPVVVLPLCLEERPPAGEVDAALLARAGRDFTLTVGRMAATERYKGQDHLLQALQRLPATPPHAGDADPPRLVIAGGGDDRPRLEALAATLGVAGRVLFTGFVSEATLAELYARAAVFAMPSRGEGFGLVYLEAMRASRPCIAARDSAAAEIVADGETGLLVDPLDPDAIAAALGRLLASPELAHAMGEAGRRRFEQLFTPRRFRERLWPLLDRLTGEGLPRTAVTTARHDQPAA
ncbi:MAG TPA: glycosyltransferase family 4 protein [Thermoanaerobaculia bacterium]|jgi:phosphatidylinositol alpha-1,6-mannosyltransferase|nr:glycosyltransferase family 4 protein [Thermoanaerobaculia bacterium]